MLWYLLREAAQQSKDRFLHQTCGFDLDFVYIALADCQIQLLPVPEQRLGMPIISSYYSPLFEAAAD